MFYSTAIVLLFLTTVSVALANRTAVIRNPHSGFVLDGSEHYVKLQHFTGFSSQLWSLEAAETGGTYFLINSGNGLAMDPEGGPSKEAKVITHPKHGGLSQQWYINSDGTIVNALDLNLTLDIIRAIYQSGTQIEVFPIHKNPNQIFQLQYQ